MMNISPIFPLSNDQIDRLRVYESVFRKWQRRINLVADSTLDDIWQRHFLDSLQLLPLAENWHNWIDIGSGAGFPGLVIAVTSLKENDAVHLVEADKRKAAFLAEVSRETGVLTHIHVQRIENVLPTLASEIKFDIISARALAPLKVLVEYATPVLKRGGKGLFLKGKEALVELTEVSPANRLTCRAVPSVTNSNGKIIIVEHQP